MFILSFEDGWICFNLNVYQLYLVAYPKLILLLGDPQVVSESTQPFAEFELWDGFTVSTKVQEWIMVTFWPSPSVSRKYWNNFCSFTDQRTLLDRQGTPSMTEEINSFRSMVSSSLGPMLVPETMHCSPECHKVPFTLSWDVANVQR